MNISKTCLNSILLCAQYRHQFVTIPVIINSDFNGTVQGVTIDTIPHRTGLEALVFYTSLRVAPDVT